MLYYYTRTRHIKLPTDFKVFNHFYKAINVTYLYFIKKKYINYTA